MGCVDPCPAYRAKFTSSGGVEFEGNEESPLTGSWKGHVSVEDFDALVTLALQLGYQSFEERYGEPGLHFGPVRTSLVIDGTRKSVTDHGFYHPQGPLHLQWVEAAIDVLLHQRVEGWERTSDRPYSP